MLVAAWETFEKIGLNSEWYPNTLEGAAVMDERLSAGPLSVHAVVVRFLAGGTGVARSQQFELLICGAPPPPFRGVHPLIEWPRPWHQSVVPA